jgi:hemolysin D
MGTANSPFLIDMKNDVDNKKELTKVSSAQLDFLPDPDAIEQRPLAGVTQWVLYGLLSMLVVFVAWATFSDIDEIVTSRGQLVTSKPNVVVQPMETSIIQTIDVRVGQVVKKGQRLAALDPTFAAADESQLRGGLSSLDARTRRLEGELSQPSAIAGQAQGGHFEDAKLQEQLKKTRSENYRVRLLSLDENLARLEASLKTNQQDQQMQESRVKSLSELEGMQERLISKNFGARQHLLEAKDKKLEVERDLQFARNREAEIRREIAAAKADRAAFQKDWQQRSMEELAEVRRDRNSTVDQLKKAEKRRSLINVTAPVDAVVLEITKLSTGSVAREAETLFKLVPLDVPLELEAKIEAADVGFVKVGDSVRIKLDAYPFQKHGSLQGHVQMVSLDAFTRESNQERAAGTSYYLARIRLDTAKLENVRGSFRLLPGLSATGEIKVGERSVISYFLYPIIGTLDQSLREPR